MSLWRRLPGHIKRCERNVTPNTVASSSDQSRRLRLMRRGTIRLPAQVRIVRIEKIQECQGRPDEWPYHHFITTITFRITKETHPFTMRFTHVIGTTSAMASDGHGMAVAQPNPDLEAPPGRSYDISSLTLTLRRYSGPRTFMKPNVPT